MTDPLEIRLSESCGTCVFFKGNWNKDGGTCNHPALSAPRPTGKLGRCDGYTRSARQERIFTQNRTCTHGEFVDILTQKSKGVTPNGVGVITLRLTQRCRLCEKFFSRSVRHIYEYVLNRKYQKPVMTKVRDEEFRWTAVRWRKFILHRPVPVYTP